MKKIVLLFLSQIVINTFAQNCGIDTWIKDNYLNDAKILALREIYANPSIDYADSIDIPIALTNKYLDALSTIYLLDNGVTDTIFSVYDIHSFPNIPYMEIAMIGDTNYSWIKDFLADSVISGNSQFDSIMVKYNFKLQSYINLSIGASIRITTPQYLNLYPLVDSLNNIQGLDNVEAMESWAGDGDNIELSISNDTTYIDFSIGWGDCPSGCINRKYWNFSIYDCNVTYLGTSGDNFTSIDELYKNDFNIYPNPVMDILTIEKWDKVQRIDFYDIHGKLIISYDQISNQLDLSDLETGQYLLRITNKNNYKTFMKIIKR